MGISAKAESSIIGNFLLNSLFAANYFSYLNLRETFNFIKMFSYSLAYKLLVLLLNLNWLVQIAVSTNSLNLQ